MAVSHLEGILIAVRPINEVGRSANYPGASWFSSVWLQEVDSRACGPSSVSQELREWK